MLILAIDTSHKNGSVCLARGDSNTFELIGSADVDGGMFSAQLVPVTARLLAKHHLNKNDLRGIAAAVGPGSFTGLRIGLAAVKGFAEVLQIPIAGVSTLEAVASLAEDRDGNPVLAVLDAGRTEIYVGEYSGAELKCVSEILCSREEFASRLRQMGQAILVSPESFVGDLARAVGVVFHLVSHPKADVIAQLGMKKLVTGEAIPVDELDANYLRRDKGLFTSAK